MRKRERERDRERREEMPSSLLLKITTQTSDE